jgi:protein O-GlcNAc transferase
VLMGITSDAAQKSLEDRLAFHGVAKDRLTFQRFAALDEYRRQLLQTDICLDTFPYNGGTTTCETLWLGLPLVTMMGQSFVSRMGFAILKDLGLPELAASSYPEYVNIAIQLAQNLERLSALRSEMRARLAKSSLSDERGFAIDLENAYRAMWRKYVIRITD